MSETPRVWTDSAVALSAADLTRIEADIAAATSAATDAAALAKAAADALAAHLAEAPIPTPTPVPTSGSVAPSAHLDVEGKFGGGWAGLKRAVAEAHASGGPSAYVLLGKQDYAATDTIHITRPISIVGQGSRGSRIKHAGSFAGPVFRAANLKRSGEWESTSGTGPIQTYNRAKDDGGLELRDFCVIDDDRSVPNRQGIYILDGDDMLFDNLTFGFLTGTALKLGADDKDASEAGVASGRVRESDFRRIKVYRCGSGSPDGAPDVPAFILQNGNDAGDGSNQNYFHQFRFVYNEGRMLIRGPGNGGNSLRRTIFRDMQLHALADNKNWNPVQYFPLDIVTLEGSVGGTLIDGLMVNGTRAGTACVVMKGQALNAETPKRLVMRNVHVVNVDGDLVRVEKGDAVAVDGHGLGSVGGKIINSLPGSGLQRYYVHELGINSPAGKVSTTSGVGKVQFSGFDV